MPGNLSFPRWVRGCEWPPRRATSDRSRLNLSISHSTSPPLFAQRISAIAGFFAPPFRVSLVKISVLSLIPKFRWDFVLAPLMPLVAFVELPPQKEDLSSSTTLPPHSMTEFAADMPPRPPPTTMALFDGKTHAILAQPCVRANGRKMVAMSLFADRLGKQRSL